MINEDIIFDESTECDESWDIDNQLADWYGNQEYDSYHLVAF